MARIELGDEPITIGRDARQSLVLVDTKVSRVHARVSLVKGDVVVEDLGSTNGTFLNGQRISKPVKLKDGRTLGIGNHLVTYQRRSRREFERALELDRDLQKASEYLASLLPAPLTAGPVRTDWRFVPSTQLGGDAFGYQWLDPNTFAFYLIDISGHGAGAAMHSVAVLNVLRQHALPQVDFANPAEILASLNNRFQMDSHNGMFFTMWYGVYRHRNPAPHVWVCRASSGVSHFCRQEHDGISWHTLPHDRRGSRPRVSDAGGAGDARQRALPVQRRHL